MYSNYIILPHAIQRVLLLHVFALHIASIRELSQRICVSAKRAQSPIFQGFRGLTAKRRDPAPTSLIIIPSIHMNLPFSYYTFWPLYILKCIDFCKTPLPLMLTGAKLQPPGCSVRQTRRFNPVKRCTAKAQSSAWLKWA
jgi:hypothetical protein